MVTHGPRPGVNPSEGKIGKMPDVRAGATRHAGDSPAPAPEGASRHVHPHPRRHRARRRRPRPPGRRERPSGRAVRQRQPAGRVAHDAGRRLRADRDRAHAPHRRRHAPRPRPGRWHVPDRRGRRWRRRESRDDPAARRPALSLAMRRSDRDAVECILGDVLPFAPSTPTLIGRGDDLAALGAALEQARGGRPTTVVLAGEAGIGKTRLVHEFSGHAVAQGARVLTGACVDLGDAALPYAAIADALRGLPRDAFTELGPRLCRALAAIVPDAAPDDVEGYDGGRSGVFGAVLRLVEQLGREAPLVIVLEDIHWADRSTEALLRFLLAGLRGAAVLVVLTFRTDEVRRDHAIGQLVAELGRAPGATTRRLAPLTRAQTAGQLAAIAGAPVPGETIDAIHARSDGNPFFSAELLALSSAGDHVPATLRDTLVARLDRLPAPATRVVRVAAACGRHIDHDLLATASALGDEQLDEALRACVAGHVLEVDEERRGYRFRHALLQEVAVAELLPGEQRRLHAQIAQLLEARAPRTGMAEAHAPAEIAVPPLQAGEPPAALAAAAPAARAAEAGP